MSPAPWPSHRRFPFDTDREVPLLSYCLQSRTTGASCHCGSPPARAPLGDTSVQSGRKRGQTSRCFALLCYRTVTLPSEGPTVTAKMQTSATRDTVRMDSCRSGTRESVEIKNRGGRRMCFAGVLDIVCNCALAWVRLLEKEKRLIGKR